MGLGSSLASLCFRDHSSVTFPQAALLSLCLKFISGVFHQNIPGTLEWIHLSSGRGLLPPLEGMLVLFSTWDSSSLPSSSTAWGWSCVSDDLAGFGLLQDGTFCFMPWCGVLNHKGINMTCSCLELCFSVLNKNLSLDSWQKIFYLFKLFLEGSR